MNHLIAGVRRIIVSEKLMSITVKGKNHTWSFDTYADPVYLDEWLDDGLEIYEVSNSIPMWVVEYGLVKPWCFMQDIFNLNNPFKSGDTK
jgi:hypothetical protein